MAREMFYSCWVSLGDDRNKAEMAVDEWVVTSVRGGVVHVKNTAEYSDARERWLEGSPPKGFARSRAQAISLAVPQVDEAIRRLEKLRATLGGQRTRARNKAKPKALRLSTEGGK